MINLGIIGCGYWGPNFIRNFNCIKGSSVKYICDLSSARLSYLKGLYPDIAATQNYLQILRDNDIDAVVIATPVITHYKLAKDALLYNKHVLVEKPIATKINEVKELIKIARRNERVLMVGHTFKFNPAVIKLRKLVQKGILGEIYYIYCRRTNLGPLRQDINAIWDLAPHDISIVNYLLGRRPIFVQAQGGRYLPHHLEDVSFISLTFPSQILVHIHVSWLDPKKIREIVIVGSKKMAIFDDLDLNAPICVYDKGVMMKKFKQEYDSFEEFQTIIKNGSVERPKIKMEEPLKIECKHFISCLRSHQAPLTDGYDGLEVLKILLAIQSSISSKKCQYIK